MTSRFDFLFHHKSLFWAVISIALAGKIVTVWHYGPMALGDNQGFIDAANEILTSSNWLHNAGLDQHVFPPTLWRPIGYSLIIAGFQLFFGANWAIAVCAFQAGLSLFAGLMLYRLCRIAGLSLAASSIVFLFHQWSAPLSTDALIMEDALTGSLGMMAFILFLAPLVKGERISAKGCLVVGMVAALSFLIRDVYHFVMPVLGLLTFVVLSKTRGIQQAFLPACMLVLPVFLCALVLQGWNQYRTGYPVTTTAGQTAYLYGVLRAAQYDKDLIAGPTVMEKVARETNKTFDYVDTKKVNYILFNQHGMNSIEQAKQASGLFWKSLFSNPIPMVRAALDRVRIIQQGTLFSGPITRIDDLDWWAGMAQEKAFQAKGWRAEAQTFRETLDPSTLTPRAFFHLGLRTVIRILGLTAFAALVILTPLYWWKVRPSTPGLANAALIVWFVYALWVCMYIPVSFETRYLSPIIGLALFVLALVLPQWRWLLRRRNEKPDLGNKPDYQR